MSSQGCGSGGGVGGGVCLLEHGGVVRLIGVSPPGGGGGGVGLGGDCCVGYNLGLWHHECRLQAVVVVVIGVVGFALWSMGRGLWQTGCVGPMLFGGRYPPTGAP